MRYKVETPTADIDGSGKDGSGGYIEKERSPKENLGEKNEPNVQTFDINLPVGTLFDFNKWEKEIYSDNFFNNVREWIEDNKELLENVIGGTVSTLTIYGNISTIGALIVAGTSAPISLTLLGAVAIPSLFLNSYFLGTALNGQFNSNDHLLSSFVYSPTKMTVYTISTIYGLNQKTAVNNARNAGYIESTIKHTPNILLPDYFKRLEYRPNLKIQLSNLP